MIEWLTDSSCANVNNILYKGTLEIGQKFGWRQYWALGSKYML